jgi:hypothetical protein
MSPLKYSSQTLSPPIRKGAVDELIDPEIALVATWVPFTYSRIVVPSYVAAKWDQAVSGRSEAAAAS